MHASNNTKIHLNALKLNTLDFLKSHSNKSVPQDYRTNTLYEIDLPFCTIESIATLTTIAQCTRCKLWFFCHELDQESNDYMCVYSHSMQTTIMLLFAVVISRY